MIGGKLPEATFALKWKAKWFHRDQFLWQQNVADLSINESHKESSRQQIILLSLFDLRKAKGEILCDEILATDRSAATAILFPSGSE